VRLRRLAGLVAARPEEVQLGELHARRHAELAEDVAEVEVDRPGAEEEVRCDLPVAEPLRHEAGDLELLLREVLARARLAPACRLAARAELLASPLRPLLGTELLEAARASRRSASCGSSSSCARQRRAAACAHSAPHTPDTPTLGDMLAEVIDVGGGLVVMPLPFLTPAQDRR
jgi:hypothetical protein